MDEQEDDDIQRHISPPASTNEVVIVENGFDTIFDTHYDAIHLTNKLDRTDFEAVINKFNTAAYPDERRHTLYWTGLFISLGVFLIFVIVATERDVIWLGVVGRLASLSAAGWFPHKQVIQTVC